MANEVGGPHDERQRRDDETTRSSLARADGLALARYAFTLRDYAK